MDFGFFDAREDDFHSTKQFLTNYTDDSTNFDFSGFTNILVEQVCAYFALIWYAGGALTELTNGVVTRGKTHTYFGLTYNVGTLPCVTVWNS